MRALQLSGVATCRSFAPPTALIVLASLLGGTFSAIPARAALIIDDAVLAHDFENIAGTTAVALRGPNATLLGNISGSTADPLSPFSNQHLRAGADITTKNVNLNSRLTSATSALSFSMYYNDRGDAGDSVNNSRGLARLLTSFDGTGFDVGDFIFSSQRNPENHAQRYLRISVNPAGTGATIVDSLPLNVNEDGLWHHVGFVFESGTVQFYFDGQPLGSPQTMPGYAAIPAQTRNWHLVEDTAGGHEDFFHGGDYDEAALWLRALSTQEMQLLGSVGLGAISPLPEPNSLLMMGWLLAVAGVVGWRRATRAGH